MVAGEYTMDRLTGWGEELRLGLLVIVLSLMTFVLCIEITFAVILS